MDNILHKKQCKEHTFDIEFCTKSCLLVANQQCEESEKIGSDRCPEDTECSPNKDGVHRCRPLEEKYDYEIDWSFLKSTV